jgi:hypothetical protein
MAAAPTPPSPSRKRLGCFSSGTKPVGRAAAINRGVQEATASIICVLHADTLLPYDAVAVMRRVLADTGTALGRLHPPAQRTGPGPLGNRFVHVPDLAQVPLSPVATASPAGWRSKAGSCMSRTSALTRTSRYPRVSRPGGEPSLGCRSFARGPCSVRLLYRGNECSHTPSGRSSWCRTFADRRSSRWKTRGCSGNCRPAAELAERNAAFAERIGSPAQSLIKPGVRCSRLVSRHKAVDLAPSRIVIPALSAPQSRAAVSTTVSSTGCTSEVERLMTLSTSLENRTPAAHRRARRTFPLAHRRGPQVLRPRRCHAARRCPRAKIYEHAFRSLETVDLELPQAPEQSHSPSLGSRKPRSDQHQGCSTTDNHGYRGVSLSTPTDSLNSHVSDPAARTKANSSSIAADWRNLVCASLYRLTFLRIFARNWRALSPGLL